jgi:hypothetical protein
MLRSTSVDNLINLGERRLCLEDDFGSTHP